MAFQNLVFEGGGVKGMAYAGALEVTRRFVKGYGLYEGNTCETWVREQIATLTRQLTGTARSELTFGQLRALATQYPGVCRELYVVTTNLTRQLPRPSGCP
jgi:predicted acylesterase/phospholipase RssA